MVRFYDPRDRDDLFRVQALLKGAGIEYSLSKEPVQGISPCQILVAEEDIPQAEELLRQADRKGGQPL